jgi:hypothetical protein
MNKAETYVIYVGSADVEPADISFYVEGFCKRNAGLNISVVSFIDVYPTSLEDLGQCMKWREAMTYDDMYSVWQAAYDELKHAKDVFPPSAKELVEINYHDIATDIWKWLALSTLMAKQQGPTCYLVADHWRGLKLNVGLDVSLSKSVVPGSLLNKWKKKIFEKVKNKATILLGQDLYARIRVSVIKPLFSGKNFLLSCSMRQLCRGILCFALSSKLRTLKCRLTLGVYKDKLDIFFRKFFVSQTARLSDNSRDRTIVMTVEDSGTKVNFLPGLRIANEFLVNEVPLIVVSSSEWVVQEFERAGYSARQVRNKKVNYFYVALQSLRLRLELMRIVASNPVKTVILIKRFLSRFGVSNIASKVATNALLTKINETNEICAVLSVYEALPLSITAGEWSSGQDIPWLGFFPILLGERPDADHFPAPLHLVYGEQLKDFMVSKGVNPDSIFVTGSPTYDTFIGRDLAADSQYCQRQLPRLSDKKLVLLATEAFSDPITELGPVLDGLAQIIGIFVVVKVHPADELEFFENYAASHPLRASIQVVQDIELGALLHRADLLICIVSNLIVSAAVLGTPTLVCDFSNKRRVLDFVEMGAAIGCFDPKAVHRMVTEILFPTDGNFNRESILNKARGLFNGTSDGSSASRIVNHVLSKVVPPLYST